MFFIFIIFKEKKKQKLWNQKKGLYKVFNKNKEKNFL